MDDVRFVYNDLRETWNVYVNGEWYFESTDYEKAEEVYCNCLCSE